MTYEESQDAALLAAAKGMPSYDRARVTAYMAARTKHAEATTEVGRLEGNLVYWRGRLEDAEKALRMTHAELLKMLEEQKP